jgi:hypothetical protein
MVMRILTVVGVGLIALGTLVVSGRPAIRSKQNILEFGEFKATVEERHALPIWTGVLGVSGGVVLILVGSRRREAGPDRKRDAAPDRKHADP